MEGSCHCPQSLHIHVIIYCQSFPLSVMGHSEALLSDFMQPCIIQHTPIAFAHVVHIVGVVDYRIQ